jgi:hypothetical protein
MTTRVMVLVAALALGTAALPAQRPLRLGIAGGVSLPAGDLREGSQAGWHGLGTLALGGPKQALGLRVDAAYHRFGLDDGGGVTAVDGARTVASATGNVTYRLPSVRSPFSPYVITGLGAYHAACTGEVSCDGSTRFGWNAGAGTKLYLRGVTSFVEARWHHTSRGGSGTTFVPLTFGLLF